jgi:hypothetical protein
VPGARFLTLGLTGEPKGPNWVAVYPSMWAVPVLWPDCPPTVSATGRGVGRSSLSGAHRVVSGGGQLGYLCCDAITCLSIGQ